MKKLVLVFSFVIGAATIFLRCTDSVSTTEVESDSPLAWKLASIDADTRTPPTSLVIEWQWQLSRLDRKANLRKPNGAPSEGEVGNVIVSCFNMMANSSGPKRDLLSVARSIDASVPSEGVSWVDFQEIALVTMVNEIDGNPLVVKDPDAKRPRQGFERSGE